VAAGELIATSCRLSGTAEQLTERQPGPTGYRPAPGRRPRIDLVRPNRACFELFSRGELRRSLRAWMTAERNRLSCTCRATMRRSWPLLYASTSHIGGPRTLITARSWVRWFATSCACWPSCDPWSQRDPQGVWAPSRPSETAGLPELVPRSAPRGPRAQCCAPSCRQAVVPLVRCATTAGRALDSAPGRIRTCGTRFRKPMLYPLSYGGSSAAGRPGCARRGYRAVPAVPPEN
jgi:hypothetical protein